MYLCLLAKILTCQFVLTSLAFYKLPNLAADASYKFKELTLILLCVDFILIIIFVTGKNTKLSSKRILLLQDTKKITWELTDKYSNRVSAVNKNTYKLLNDIGAWKHISDVRFASVQKMQV